MAVGAGVPLLPVHDSFIVKGRNAEFVKKLIKTAYGDLMSFDPVIDWD